MIKSILSACFFFVLLNGSAQLQSPDEFLGYKIGSRFTHHWKVVNYIEHVARSVPAMVKIQKYGETNEGRSLMVVIISSQENIQRLEDVRLNNLRLAGEGDKQSGSKEKALPIVWLSYNVHGNEASSTEAAMMTLYSLADPANTRTKSWLKNTMVVIDPCLNPDGRDRYVNWFSSMAGSKSNPDPNAREHFEPWSPGGRTNHYYFDLNRDWAWQTQVETEQRMKVYNNWLPHIHVDFHEQWAESPYYFAPAAQPYHEVITPWQRDFQTTIGRNNARYFDAQSWLFFTKEYFDLLYPSYGDTYPIFTGSIGMTYEQAGHSLGGTSLTLESGDTLTLHDRALHHYTSSLSTIEVASLNAAKLITEFSNFFSAAIKNGVGEYKTFVIKNNIRDAERIKALQSLLTKNKIDFGTTKNSSLRGFNYATGKDENFNVTSGDLVISTMQPRGVLVKVLFEPNTTVVDSVTYDITAWSLPYAYGLSTYGVKQAVDITPSQLQQGKVNNPATLPYGYIIRWDGLKSVKLVSQLLQRGIKLRFTELPIEINGQQFDRGSVIVLKTSNQQFADLWEIVRKAANENNVELVAVSTGYVDKGIDFGSGRIHLLKKKNVALITGQGTSANASGEVWHFFDKTIDHPITLINLSDINDIDLNKYDILIMVNGSYNFLNEKAGADKLKDWVTRGGKLIAMENAVGQLAKAEFGIKSRKKDENTDTSTYSPLRRYENRERDFIPNITPGSIYKVELDTTHPLAFGYPAYYYTLKQDDAMYEYLKERGWNVGIIRKNYQVAGFVGSKLKNRLQDGLIFGVQDMGAGNIVYLADNVLFRGFWENGKMLFCNAVFLVGQ